MFDAISSLLLVLGGTAFPSISKASIFTICICIRNWPEEGMFVGISSDSDSSLFLRLPGPYALIFLD